MVTAAARRSFYAEFRYELMGEAAFVGIALITGEFALFHYLNAAEFIGCCRNAYPALFSLYDDEGRTAGILCSRTSSSHCGVG